MVASTWTETVRIPSYHVTPQGTASVLALADYFQEAAGHHADELGVSMQDLLAEDRAWVLGHFHLDLSRLPQWTEEITIETWPSGIDRLLAIRDVLFRDENEQVLARGTSAWLIIDTERRRPVRLPPSLHEMALPDRSRALARDREDLPPPTRVDRTGTFLVRYHDLDLNRHVNNVRYLEWALETLPAKVLDERQCTSLALQFEDEATLGDPVRATAQLDDDDAGLRARHRLAHTESNRTLALAATTWR